MRDVGDRGERLDAVYLANLERTQHYWRSGLRRGHAPADDRKERQSFRVLLDRKEAAYQVDRFSAGEFGYLYRDTG